MSIMSGDVVSESLPSIGDLDRRFGTNIKAWRNAAGLSQAALARRLFDMTEGDIDLLPTTITKIEKGTRPLKLAEALVVAAVFGEPIGALAGDKKTIEHDLAAFRIRAAERELDAARRAFPGPKVKVLEGVDIRLDPRRP